MKVGVESFDAATGKQTFYTVPAKRQITVQDLLRHTSGFTYGAYATNTQVQKLYKDAGLFSQKWTLESFCKELAKLPLMYEPGTVWEYGHSTDVLGRVVEVAAGPAAGRLSLRTYIQTTEDDRYRVSGAPGKAGTHRAAAARSQDRNEHRVDRRDAAGHVLRGRPWPRHHRKRLLALRPDAGQRRRAGRGSHSRTSHRRVHGVGSRPGCWASPRASTGSPARVMDSA